jgi:hypothetical protein
MKRPEDSRAAPRPAKHADVRRRIASRVAAAHEAALPGPLLALVSGSTVEELADERSDVDMGIVLPTLPDRATLEAACAQAGGTAWFWCIGDAADGGLVAAFHVQGIETQVAYSTRERFEIEIDEVLLRHNPDTPLHKLAEGVLKAEPLAGADALRAVQQRLARFPPELGLAMVRHWIATPTPWKAITQILHRDAALWCRELLVEACWRQLGMLAGLNQRYFTRFQLKRMGKLAAGFAIAPAQLAERIDALLQAPLPAAFDALHGLEGEVLALVARHQPAVDTAPAERRRRDYAPDRTA